MKEATDAKAAITTRYFGPANLRGSRILASNGDLRVYHEVDNTKTLLENHAAAAVKLCQKYNWVGTLAMGQLLHIGYVWVWLEFGKDSKYSCDVIDIEANGEATGPHLYKQ